MKQHLAPALLIAASLGCSTVPAAAAVDRASTLTATPRPSGPRIVASATTVAPGGKVTLTVYGLGTGTIDVEWNGTVFAKVQSTGSQPFQLVLTMPALADPGKVTITLL